MRALNTRWIKVNKKYLFFVAISMHSICNYKLELVIVLFNSSQFISVTQSCPTLCDSIDCNMPGFPVHHQEIPGVTDKFGLGVQKEAGQRLTEFWQENALVIANILFQQHKRRLYTWTSPHDQYQNQIDYVLCSQRWRSYIQQAKTIPEADCGSDPSAPYSKIQA